MTTAATPAEGSATPDAPVTAAAAPVTAAPVAAPAAPAAPAAAPATEEPVAPRDWASLRTDYAKGDEKLLKRLERYSSEEAVIDALIAAQNKIATGGLKSPLPKDPTPEQVADWRRENGIPEKPEDYEITLPEGRTLGEADAAFVDDFIASAAHATNMTPEQASAAVAWYQDAQERELAARHQMDAEITQEATATLRAEWGSEMQLNKNMISGLLDAAPEGVKDGILGGRLADGTPIVSDVKVLRWLANIAREVNPVATVVPGSSGNAAQAIESELASIQKLMGDHKSDYWKGPQAEKMQSRYRELISVQEKMQRR